MEIRPTTLALVYTTCLQRVRGAPAARRRAFVTALQDACEGDKETYKETARARDREEWGKS